MAAALKGHCDVAMGNALGSNIFNILFILGIASFFGDIPFPDRFLKFDLWVMLASALILVPVYLRKTSVSKLYGGFMVALYIAYLIQLSQSGMV